MSSSLSKYVRIGKVDIEGAVGFNVGIASGSLKVAVSDVGGFSHCERPKEAEDATQYQPKIQQISKGNNQ